MSPVVVEVEVDISRPPEQVFDYCSDPGREPEWNPLMKPSKKITDGPLGVGSRYATEFVKGPPMVMECVGYERPSAWSLVGRSSALTAGGGGIQDLREQYESNLKLLMGASGLVLLIACANIANLLLVRGMRRKMDM